MAEAIYRENSRKSQPLNAGGEKKADKKVEGAAAVAAAVASSVVEPMQRELFARAQREKMPAERASVTHKFSVGGHEGYITVGLYLEHRTGEVFLKMSKES